MMSRGRRFCLTLNNWTEEEYSSILKHMNTKPFWIIGKEVGESGTPHLQIYFESKNPMTFKTIKNWNNRLHIEKANGNRRQNYEYCSKDNDFKTNIEEKDLEKPKKKEPLSEKELCKHFSKHFNNEKIKEHLDLIDFFIDNFDRIFLEWTPEKIKSKVNNMIEFLKELSECKLCKSETILINLSSLLRLKDNFLS